MLELRSGDSCSKPLGNRPRSGNLSAWDEVP